MTENDQNDRVSPQQEQAVIQLALENSTAKAAVKIGVSDRTVRRWTNLPAFKAAFREQARQNSEQAMCALRAAQLQAVNVLWEQLNDSNALVQYRAAALLLETGMQLTDQDVEERLSELERSNSAQMQQQRALGAGPSWP